MIRETNLSNAKFQEGLERRLKLIREVLSSKATEYAKDNAEGEDRMHNFNVSMHLAPNLFKTREDAIMGFLVKHLTSVEDILADLRQDKYPDLARLEEKLGDVINYYILLEISIRQGIEEQMVTNIHPTYEPVDDLPF